MTDGSDGLSRTASSTCERISSPSGSHPGRPESGWDATRTGGISSVGRAATRHTTSAGSAPACFVRHGSAPRHSIDHFWREDGDFRGWYVNLQEPLRETAVGLDTCDLALDLWVEADGAWHWKDEDDFAEMQTLGIVDEQRAAAIRAEGERVISAWPFPTGWEDWRPDPAWPVPELPADWDVV